MSANRGLYGLPPGRPPGRVYTFDTGPYRIPPDASLVLQTGAGSGARQVYLPPAGSVPAGWQLTIIDSQAVANGSNYMQIYPTAHPTDTIPGSTISGGGVQSPAGAAVCTFISDGLSKWYLANGMPWAALGYIGGTGGSIIFRNQSFTNAAAIDSGNGWTMLASNMKLSWGSPGATAPTVSIYRVADSIVGLDAGFAGTPAGWLNYAGRKRVATQFDKTSDTTLANITGLSVTLISGRTYTFLAKLFTSSTNTGGVKVAMGGTATATAIRYDVITHDNAAVAGQSRQTALAGAAGVTAVTAAQVEIAGTITCNAAGTLTVQFAQNVSDAAASSVLVGSWLNIDDTP